ncbi:hypothetical protein [Neobacillus sp.]|uniref:hypothetical protein n=1 Tax=Neobacillus sp. TaxID=2675273 RepID=UPI00289794E9|nr:hypothetical protein [Neobacillus sp.]
METRTYFELRRFVENLYNSKDNQSLKRYSFKNKEGQIHIYKNTPTELPIVYGEGTLNEHSIELRVPGRLTFKHRITGDITDDIQRFDIRIRLKNKRWNEFITPKHTEIVEDLFNKIASVQNEDTRKKTYNALATILQNIYFDLYPFKRLNMKEEDKYQKEYKGFSLPELVTFIKWCTLQEDINFPSNNNYGKDDWGKDLLFARYYEAINAGLYQDSRLLKQILVRTNNHGQDKPALMDKRIYQGTLATRFDLENVWDL